MSRLRLFGCLGGLDRRLLPFPERRHPELEEHFAPGSEMGLDRGPEIGGGNFLSDTSPEEKAAELRAQSTVHYRESERAGAGASS